LIGQTVHGQVSAINIMQARIHALEKVWSTFIYCCIFHLMPVEHQELESERFNAQTLQVRVLF
jgi:hypothetical protein